MIIGHEKQLSFLKKAVEKGTIAHAYLFSGQEKLGKKKIALEIISLLLGKKIEKDQHPDFALIEPIGKEIQIDQIRDLIWKLSLKPYSAPFKTALIDSAHLMNREAQTAFLKTLEEPRGKTVLILVAEYPDALLPAIISRIQEIKFYPVKKEEIKNYLKEKGASEEKIENILEVSQGKPGLAIELLENPEKLKEKEKIIKEVIKISNSSLSFRFQCAKNLSEDPNLIDTLNNWLVYFRKNLISQAGTISSLKTKNILKSIQKTISLISTTNINQRLALELLMMEL